MTEQNNQTILEVSGLTMQFGGIKALDKLDLRIRHREIAALIGPNGAGKTTTMKMLTGFMPPTHGHISIDGFDVFTGEVNDFGKAQFVADCLGELHTAPIMPTNKAMPAAMA